MLDADRVAQLKDLLPNFQSALVVLGPRPTIDQLASALAIFEALQTLGKEVEIAAPGDLSSELADVSGSELVRQKLGNRNLTISFPYSETAVDKVSYNISEDNRHFYLVIKPRKGERPLEVKEVEFDYTGAEAELIFLVGVHSYESLDHLYSGYEQLYEQATVVTVNTFEPEIGSIKLDVSGYSSMSEGVVRLLQGLETVDYIPQAKTQQQNWIGRSEGATIKFGVRSSGCPR